jgi:quinol monooxygenase YgiN
MMVAQTVVMTCILSEADAVEAALIEVVNHVRAFEPGTTDYRVLRADDADTGAVFTTVEIFDGPASMDAHNASTAVARFFERTEGLLSAPPAVTVSKEVARK